MRRMNGTEGPAAGYIPPPSRQTGMILEPLDDELLVYDEARHQAHALNAPATQVLQACDGTQDLESLGRLLAEGDAGVQVAWWAVWQLSRARLLEGRVQGPAMSRRQLLRGLVRSAVVLPAVATLLAPTTAAAASCSILHLSCKVMPCCLGLTCSGPPLYLCL